MTDFESRLRAQFPVLFREPVRCGFYCPPGWEKLVTELSAKLEPLVAALPEDERPCVDQVKSKFGSLRYYVTLYNEEIGALITEAEEASESICEECGEPAVLRVRGHWMLTVCDKHAQVGDRIATWTQPFKGFNSES